MITYLLDLEIKLNKAIKDEFGIYSDGTCLHVQKVISNIISGEILQIEKNTNNKTPYNKGRVVIDSLEAYGGPEESVVFRFPDLRFNSF